MSAVDWLVLVASLVGIVGYGLLRSRGEWSVHAYVSAGKQMRWWVIGLSIMATQASAITFIGTTSQGFADGLRFVQFYFGLPVAMVLISAYAAPAFHRSGVRTAYEYLERRFDAKTRTLASWVFLLQRGLGVGLALYAPAVVLSVILHVPEWPTILGMVVLVSAYTVLGGIRAVMWADTLQMAVMLAGIVIAFGCALVGLPDGVSFRDALFVAGTAGKLNAVETGFDWNSRYTLWSGLIGGTFLALAYFGTDQSQVQRYLTAKSLNDSRVSLLFNATVKVPLQFFILLTGVLVFSFFVFEPPPLLFHPAERMRIAQEEPAAMARLEDRFAEALSDRREAATKLLESRGSAETEAFGASERRLGEVREEAVALVERDSGPGSYSDTNYIFLTFVLSALPPGLIGLIIAGVFAAAMSTISSELNSLATVTVVDHYARYVRPAAGERNTRKALHWATLGWSAYAAAFATFGGRLGSLIEAVNLVGSLFYGPMLGVFVLAFGVRRVSSEGAFWGTALGLASVWGAKLLIPGLAFLWLNPLGCIATVVAALAISGAAGGNPSSPAMTPTMEPR
ncbi:MAG: sodium:solute symporter [Bryobacterales bacterium]|nr:sodium:solute symporter [Bryobacterales bacterium]